MEIRLAGAGNHGMIPAGQILQEAAVVYSNLNAHHVQSYGPEARGNAARSEVIISDADIDRPHVSRVNAFLSTTQEALERYTNDLASDAIVVIDRDLTVHVPPGVKVYELPLVQTAERELRRPMLLHIVALGAIVELSGIVGKDALASAVKDHVARGSEAIHIAALEAGYELARKARASSTPN